MLQQLQTLINSPQPMMTEDEIKVSVYECMRGWGGVGVANMADGSSPVSSC